jgi:hypothetical protein
MVMAEKDDIKMIGGDPAPLEWAQQHVTFLRDEMARIIGQSALNLTHNAKMLNRSMESKAFDRKAMQIILEHLGKICKDYAEQLFDMVAAGRNETGLVFRASGMEDYEQLGVDELADTQLKIGQLNLPSPTFNSDFAFSTVKQLMEGAPKERLDIISKELEEGYKQKKEQSEQLHQAAIEPTNIEDNKKE